MANLGFNINADLGDRFETWRQQFVSQTSYRRYERACAWACDETAKRLATRMNEATGEVIDRPTPWMARAWQYRRGLRAGSRPGEVSAETFVKDDQSPIFKYLVGDGPNVRRPGDVGLARDRILLPNWRAFEATQGIRANRYGNLPGGVAARLAREAKGQVAKRRVRARWGVYEVELATGGSRVMGYIARPPREKRPLGKGGRMIWANVARPRILLVAVQQTVHQPILQRPFQDAVAEALRGIPELMAAELDDAVAYQARRAGRR